jgi:CDP-glycerol glycerophosphotransferase
VVSLDQDTAAIVSAPGAPTPAPVPPTTVSEVLLDGGDLLVRGRTAVPARTAERPVRLELRGQRGSVTGTVTVAAGPAGAVFEARLPLRHDPWATGDRPLPSGLYRLELVTRGGTVPLAMATELTAATPYTLTSEVFRLRVERTHDGGPRLVLAAPLRDEESGPYAQEELRRWYATDEHRLDPRTVYLQSYTGQSATDSPVAVHHAIRRLRPDLRPVWAVADRATAVPDGGEPVLIGSREWYDALATSGHLVTNIDMEGWFRKRPGQRLLQTYHGYPSKTMGIAAWRGKNLTPLRIERQLRRTSATWDLLLTPTPAMDVHYREQYRYEGPIHSRGYPRDDVLVGPDADGLRARARAALGLGDRTAVLYAPTWRDDLATNFRSAAMPSIFDVERAAQALGEEFVLLLRGHRFHQRRAGGSSRLLDVTDHPEINDLLVACDAAVLDYSSLRFDLALLGRPMVFLVPDLERYESGVRGFLYDFRGSAPGPLVSTTAEVIDALAHLERWEQEQQDRCRDFNLEFNPHQDGRSAERVVKAFLDPAPEQKLD